MSRLAMWAYNTRWRDLALWRKAVWRSSRFVEDTLWRRLIRPHVRPRAYAQEELEFWRGCALPPDIDAHVWEEEPGVWIGHLVERDGPWSLCCLQGETREEVHGHIKEMLDLFKSKAGIRYPAIAYVLWWHDEKPSNDRTWAA